MSDVLQQRKGIEERIAGMTFCTRLEQTVAERGDAPAYSDKVGIAPGEQGWRTLTWREVREQALDLAAGLSQVGLAPGNTMAIMATNRMEHVLADIAAVHASATPMSIYSTLAPEQVAYVAGHSEPTVVVLEGAAQLKRWQKALAEVPSIKAVVVLDPAAGSFEALRYFPKDRVAVLGLISNHGEVEVVRGGVATRADRGRAEPLNVIEPCGQAAQIATVIKTLVRGIEARNQPVTGEATQVIGGIAILEAIGQQEINDFVLWQAFAKRLRSARIERDQDAQREQGRPRNPRAHCRHPRKVNGRRPTRQR